MDRHSLIIYYSQNPVYNVLFLWEPIRRSLVFVKEWLNAIPIQSSDELIDRKKYF